MVSAPPITLVTVGIVLALVLVPIVLTRRSWEQIGEAERDAASAAAAPAAAEPRRDQGRHGRRPPAVLRRAVSPRQARARRSPNSAARGRRALARLGVEATLIVSMLIVVFLVMRQDVSGGDTVSVLALFAYTGFRVVPSVNRIRLNIGRPARSAAVDPEHGRRHAAPARAAGADPTITIGRCCGRRCRATTCRSATTTGRRWRSIGFRSPSIAANRSASSARPAPARAPWSTFCWDCCRRPPARC